MKTALTILSAAAFLAAASAIRGGEANAESKADDSVKEALLSAGIGYRLDEDGNFHLNVKFKSGRKQEVVVISKPVQLAVEPEGDEMREIYSVALVSDQPPSPELAARLLIENGVAKFGAWVVRKKAGQYETGFRAFIPADVCEDELLPSVSLVASLADGLEKSESGGDTH
jgi:hypothetical protein